MHGWVLNAQAVEPFGRIVLVETNATTFVVFHCATM